jgi:hypothetical protein
MNVLCDDYRLLNSRNSIEKFESGSETVYERGRRGGIEIMTSDHSNGSVEIADQSDVLRTTFS